MSEAKTEKTAPKGMIKDTATKTADKTKAAIAKKTAAKEPPAAPAGGWGVARVLKVTKPLMTGDDVKALQAALISNNYHCGVSGANGVYGKDTAYAVRCFQAHKRLIVDGKAGKFTITALGGTWKG